MQSKFSYSRYLSPWLGTWWKWKNSKDKKQVLQNKITIYTKNSTICYLNERYDEACSCGMKFWSRWTAASCWRRAANKVCVWCGRGWPQFLPACLKSLEVLQPINLSTELWYTAVCFCPTQQCTKWRRRRGGWTQLMQWRSASSVMAGPLKQWPKCFLTYSSLGKDYEKIIRKHWHILSSDPKPENEFTKNVQASS